MEVTAATVAVNVALLTPTPILALPGTVILEFVLTSVILAELAVAPVSVMLQVEVPGAITVAGEQVKLLNWAAAARLTMACWLWPLSVAVMVTF